MRDALFTESTATSRGHDELSLEALIRSVKFIGFDFDGVFTNNMVYVFEDGREAVCCTRADGIGLSKLQRLGIQTAIISTEVNPVVTMRSRKLGIRCIQGCNDKESALRNMTAQLGITLDQVSFVGNDINDLPCLLTVGFPIVVCDAHPDVLKHGRYVTKTAGGRGAVREICDLFERTRMAPAP